MVFTLTSDEFYSHAGMSRPGHCVELDISRYKRLIDVWMLDRVGIRVAFEQLHKRSSEYISCTLIL